jgi:hypothetical protein
MSELFRFMVFRPPGFVDAGDLRYVPLEDAQSGFQRALRDLAEHHGSLKDIQDAAEAFVRSDGFVSGLDHLAIPLAPFAHLIGGDVPADLAALKASIEHVFGQPAADVAGSPDFAAERRRIADSLIALTWLHRERDPVYAQLVAGARLCRQVERAAAEDPQLTAIGSVGRALQEPLILPSALFPLALAGVAAGGTGEGTGGPTPGASPMERLATLRTALDELADIPAAGFRAAASAGGGAPPVEAPGVPQVGVAPGPREPAAVAERAPSGSAEGRWLLAERGVSRLSEASREEIARLGIALDSTPLPEISAALEREMLRSSLDVYRPAATADLVPVGSVFVAADTLTAAGLGAYEVLPATLAVREPAFRELGVADLMLVREELRGYRLGEIAHIENVLHGESKERTHRRLDRRVETVLTEKETTETTERDLQSTERFELQRETQQTIHQESSFDVGVTVKYGGFVDVEASTNYATKNASELSTRAATNYSREIVDHSVSRIQERVREERVVTTLHEVEETNFHRLAAADEHVVGIYRWVDKVQDVQTLNYGERVMYEFIVPEPAVFALFARGKQVPKGVTLQEPRPPTFGPQELMWDWPSKKWVWVARPVEPLRPHHIQWWNYQQWVAQYGAEVEPPPPQHVKKHYTWQSPKLQGNVDQDAALVWEGATSKITPDAGYAAVKAWVYVEESGHGATSATGVGGRSETSVFVTVGDQSRWYSGYGPAVIDYWDIDVLTQGKAKVEGEVPVTVAAVHANMITVVVEVLCECTGTRMDTWRQKAYSAIVTAYQNLRSAYEEQLAAALTQAGIAIAGRNPALNREAEQVELKRAAITLLARQWWPHLEGVGAVVPNGELYPTTAPGAGDDYPEIDFGRFDAQAPLIQFLEQAFEWTHMVYSFYPYFWARKSSWPLLQQLDDTDPIYARFLRAGAARVLVPARDGYAASVRHYWLTGEPWHGAGAPSVTDAAFLPITEEIKETYGIDFDEGAGTLSVVADSAVVTGSAEAAFDADDVRREIRFAGRTYRIRAVDAAQKKVTLDDKYTGPTQAGVGYAVSQYRLIGDPWPVTLPTTLVYLQHDAELPVFPRE